MIHNPFIFKSAFGLNNLNYSVDTWHGEKNIAKYSTNAGVLSKRYPLDLMFDRKRNTYWHSDTELQSKVKTVSIDFNVSYFEFK